MVRYEKGTDVYTYTYNGDGQRLSKTVNGVTTEFTWDGMDMILESAGSTTSIYVYGNGINYRKTGNSVYTYTTNAHGDVVNYAQGTTVVKEYCYDAFGNELDEYDWRESENPLRYCGEYYDAETGLYYLRNRYYDPQTGRFITEDPIRDGNNWYVYCNGNPIMFTDPSGLDVYYFVSSEFRGEADRVEKMLGQKFNEPVHIIETDDGDEFVRRWEAMGTEDGKQVNISAVIINGHANSKNLNNVDVNKLKGKTIDTVLLLGCNAGNLDHIYDSPMAKIINNNNTGSVIAADGSVNYQNKGWRKASKRTRYYFTSRKKDKAFVDNLLPVNKKNENRKPVGFIKYTLYDGVLYEDWLGRDFENINSIFNKAGVYDRPSKNPS